MRVTCVDPLSDPLWARLVDEQSGSLFHSPPWLASLAAAYGFHPLAYVLLDGDSPVAGLPFCRISNFGAERLVAAPFSDYCDPLVSTSEQWDALFEALQACGLPMSFRWRDHAAGAVVQGLKLTGRARWHGVSLDAKPDTLWMRVAPSARRAVRKAARERVEVRPLDDDCLSEFVHLHVALRKRKYRLLAQPFSFFDAVRTCFDAARGWLPLAAVHRGRVVAVTVYLRWRDQLFYKFNASSGAALSVRPNDALLWEGILAARALGCSRLDLGASDDDQPGLIRFKRHYGAEEREICRYSYEPDHGHSPRERSALLRRVTELATAPVVPDHFTHVAGRLLYRYFV